MMKENKNLYFYYGFLFVVNLVLGLRYHGEAPTIMRLAFLVMVVAPALKSYRILPFVIPLFLISSTAGYIEGLMPSQLYWYAVISVVVVFLARNNHVKLGRYPISLLLLFLYITFVNYICGMTIEHISYSLIIVLAFCLLMRFGDEWALSLFSLVFALISLSLSLMFIFADPTNTHSYGYTGLERVMAFSDPNYYGCTLGMGALTSVIELFRQPKGKTLLRSFYFIVAVMSFVILILNASRGGILAFALAVAVIILFSRVNRIGKIITIVVLAGLIAFLYENDYFALLEYRIMNDTGGGSSRTAIWIYKLNVFFNQSNIFQILFGYGHNGGLAIGGGKFGYGAGKVLGFHNDFIAFLVDYGVIGLMLFLLFLYFIFRQACGNKILKVFCFSVLIFLVVHIMTLEPYTAGGLSIWVFSMYAIVISQTFLIKKQV